MILPDTLKPLPVAPPESLGGSTPSAPGGGGESFVSERSVRRLLLGPMAVATPARTEAPDEAGFAGPTLVPVEESDDSPFIILAKGQTIRQAPKPDYRPGELHPALEQGRCAPPPCPRSNVVTSFSRRLPRKPQVWLAAMAIASIGFIASATLVDYLAQKAAQQFGLSTRPVPVAPVEPEAAAPSLASRAR